MNENTGSTSTGIAFVPASAAVSAAGIRSYFANHASARERSPVASISSSTFANCARAARHPREVDPVAAIHLLNRSAFQQVVELHHLRPPVSLSRAEAQRAKQAGHIRGIILAAPRFRQRAVVHQPREAEHAGHIRLRLLETGVRRADGLADIHLPPSHARKSRAQAVRNLVQQRAGHVTLPAHFGSLVRLHHDFRDRHDHNRESA